MNNNIQIIATGKIPPCLQQTIDKTRYLVEVHFGNIQSIGEKLKRVITYLHRILEYGFTPYMPAVCEKEIPPLLKLL